MQVGHEVKVVAHLQIRVVTHVQQPLRGTPPQRAGAGPGQIVGRSPYLQAVHFDDTRAQNGEIVQVRILSSSQNSLSGVREELALA